MTFDFRALIEELKDVANYHQGHRGGVPPYYHLSEKMQDKFKNFLENASDSDLERLRSWLTDRDGFPKDYSPARALALSLNPKNFPTLLEVVQHSSLWQNALPPLEEARKNDVGIVCCDTFHTAMLKALSNNDKVSLNLLKGIPQCGGRVWFARDFAYNACVCLDFATGWFFSN